MKEFGHKIDAVEKGNIENKIATLKKSMEGDDAEAIKQDTDELAQSAHKLAEAVYAKEKPDEQGETGSGGQANKEADKGERVVDADFEEVKSKGK